MKLPPASRVLPWLAIALAVWFALRFLARLDAPPYDEQAHQHQVDAMLAQGKRHRAERAADQLAVARSRAREAAARRLADSLKGVRDTVYLPEVVPAACAPWADALSLCDKETAALRRGLSASDSAHAASARLAAREAGRADSLEQLHRTAPKPCRVPLAGVRCPEFVVGGVATWEGGRVIVRPGVAFGIPVRLF